jgi:hypothetical protein
MNSLLFYKFGSCSLVFAAKASREQQSSQLSCVMSGRIYSKRIRTKFNQIRNLTLKMDIRAFLESVVNDRIEKSRTSIGRMCKTIRDKR